MADLWPFGSHFWIRALVNPILGSLPSRKASQIDLCPLKYHRGADQACGDSLLAKKESPSSLKGKRGLQNITEGYSFFLVFFSFMLSPIMLLAVKEATMLLSISLPACGEFGNKIKLALVCSPIDWSVS